MIEARALLAQGIAQLRAAGLDGAAGDARILLAHALGVPRERLTLALSEIVSAEIAARFEAAIAARATRRPVAQIIGRRAFWGRDFIVTPDVLDPRPETETLIEAALEQPFTRVLDLGTGSGAIVLTLLAERPEATALAVDLSLPALDVAQRNATALGVQDRARFVRSDWCDAVVGQFDLIVSNPPYIGTPELEGLDPDVTLFEPRMALVPVQDDGTGLAAYRRICAQAPRHQAPGARLIVEIGHRQGPAVATLLREAGLHDVDLRHDMSGHPRVVIGRNPAP